MSKITQIMSNRRGVWLTFQGWRLFPPRPARRWRASVDTRSSPPVGVAMVRRNSPTVVSSVTWLVDILHQILREVTWITFPHRYPQVGHSRGGKWAAVECKTNQIRSYWGETSTMQPCTTSNCGCSASTLQRIQSIRSNYKKRVETDIFTLTYNFKSILTSK